MTVRFNVETRTRTICIHPNRTLRTKLEKCCPITLLEIRFVLVFRMNLTRVCAASTVRTIRKTVRKKLTTDRTMYTHVCAIHVYGLYTQVLDQLPFF